jgi:hypothetical protein
MPWFVPPGRRCICSRSAACIADVDFAFIVPFNQSTSLGISGQFDRPEFLDTVAIIEAAASAKGAAAQMASWVEDA